MKKCHATGIVFRETMSGPFMFDVADPHAGAKAGKSAGITLSITCSVTIRDLDRFISDPEHCAEMTGHVSSILFGGDVPAFSTLFKLFATSEQARGEGAVGTCLGASPLPTLTPTINPMYKLMVYELAFVYANKHYNLAGHKIVGAGLATARRASPFNLWRDTTTLYTTLHQGMDRNGPVVGAGILTMSADNLGKLVTSMHVTNADRSKASPYAQVQTLLRFGHFFFGELWESYGLFHSKT